jgi:hypothetical protein
LMQEVLLAPMDSARHLLISLLACSALV